jgi:DNA primase
MSNWIDFKALRAALDFEQVLKHYGVEIKRKGSQHLGFCPLPNHGGKKNSQSFSANLERGIFQCFGCGAKGNVIDFAAYMENLDPNDGSQLRKAAIILRNRFVPETGDTKPDTPKADIKPKPKQAPPPQPKTPVLVNHPLDFELKDLDGEHPYLLNRGFTPETIAHFGLGYCRRGLLKDRVVIPLHDHEGKLVGYAGRLVDDTKISEENPRYKFPGKRERDGKVFEFRKSLFLYNGFYLKAPADDLLVVEGFTSVWWLAQNGLPDVVATMGADCSEKQAELIALLVKPVGRVWIVPDGDKAGERYAQSLLGQIAPVRAVRWIKLESDTQPTDYDAAFFQERLGA